MFPCCVYEVSVVCVWHVCGISCIIYVKIFWCICDMCDICVCGVSMV